jgi:hypothetical protein
MFAHKIYIIRPILGEGLRIIPSPFVIIKHLLSGKVYVLVGNPIEPFLGHSGLDAFLWQIFVPFGA